VPLLALLLATVVVAELLPASFGAVGLHFFRAEFPLTALVELLATMNFILEEVEGFR